MKRLEGIEIFVQVVEAGGFTGAAERLQTSKSTVSDGVRVLEARLGVRLFDRTTRKVRPTEAGTLFYTRARRLLDELEAARDEVRMYQSAPAGHLRIAVPESFAERFILPGIGHFLTAFPAATVELIADPRHARLVDENFDLAIRIAATPSETMVVRRIGGQSIILVATPDYLSARGTPEEPADLSRHQCVGMAAPLPWHDGWRLGDQKLPVIARLIANTAEGLRAAAVAGMGIVAVPDWMVGDALADGRLVRVLTRYQSSVSGIYAVYPTNRLLTPVVRAFTDHLALELRARGIAV